MYLKTSNTESCDEDDEEVGVGVVEELVDKPGTTNDTYCNQFSHGKYTRDKKAQPRLIAGPVVSIPMILAELPERENCGSFFKKHHRHD